MRRESEVALAERLVANVAPLAREVRRPLWLIEMGSVWISRALACGWERGAWRCHGEQAAWPEVARL